MNGTPLYPYFPRTKSDPIYSLPTRCRNRTPGPCQSGRRPGRQRKLEEARSTFPGKPLLREWRAREKILRRHRRDSGLAVSIKLGWSRTGDAIFIIRRIGEPEHHVVQIYTDPGDVVKCESLIDDGIHAD